MEESIRNLNKYQLISLVAKQEFDEIKEKFADDMSLSVENIKKFYDNVYVPLITYGSDEFQDLFDSDEPAFGSVDWNEVIRQVKENGIEDGYNLHSYQDYACVFIDFTKDGIKLEFPFMNQYAMQYFEEDLLEHPSHIFGKYSFLNGYTPMEVRAIMKSNPDLDLKVIKEELIPGTDTVRFTLGLNGNETCTVEAEQNYKTSYWLHCSGGIGPCDNGEPRIPSCEEQSVIEKWMESYIKEQKSIYMTFTREPSTGSEEIYLRAHPLVDIKEEALKTEPETDDECR